MTNPQNDNKQKKEQSSGWDSIRDALNNLLRDSEVAKKRVENFQSYLEKNRIQIQLDCIKLGTQLWTVAPKKTQRQQAEHGQQPDNSSSTPEKKEKGKESVPHQRYRRDQLNKNSLKHVTEAQNIRYEELFQDKDNIKQAKGFWNCYLVSSLMTLSNTPFFKTLMESYIKRAKFKTWEWEWGYIVKLPLGEPYGREIFIKDGELNNSKVEWEIGYKILEIAYLKNRRNNGENDYPVLTQEEYQNSIGWRMQEVLQKFFWKKNLNFCTFGSTNSRNHDQRLSSANSEAIKKIEKTLKNYDASHGYTFIELITGASQNGDQDHFKVNGKTFYHSHAYAFQSIEKDWDGNIKSITVKNPRNDSEKTWGTNISLTYQEFLDTFSIMGLVTLKPEKFCDQIDDISPDDSWEHDFRDDFFKNEDYKLAA